MLRRQKFQFPSAIKFDSIKLQNEIKINKNKSYYGIHSVFILLECALGNNFNNKPPDKRDVENLDFELNIEQEFLVCSVSVERQLTSN